MRIKSFSLENYKAFSNTGVVPVGDVTSIIGRNSTGKSTIIQAIKSTILKSSIDSTRLGFTQGQNSKCIVKFDNSKIIQNIANSWSGDEISFNIIDTVNPITDTLQFSNLSGPLVKAIPNDIAWTNILSSLNLNMEDIQRILSNQFGESDLYENYTYKLSENLTETFNHYVSECLGRVYEFKIKFTMSAGSNGNYRIHTTLGEVPPFIQTKISQI